MAEHLEILLEGCKKRDPKSQHSLYMQFSAAMYGLCLQYASSEEDAKDILQDGFIKVFNKIDQVRNVKALPGWIRRVIINTALERYRSQIHLKSLDEVPGILEKEIEEDTLSSMEAAVILDMVRQLSPKYRVVFNMYAIEGYSHKEIAEILNISEGTSKSNLSRARSILQEKVKNIYNESSINGE